MDCFVFMGRKWRRHLSQSKRIEYRRLLDNVENSESSVTVVVGKEKRVFVVDSCVLEKDPFRVLLEMLSKKERGLNENEEQVIFIDVDAILFEHMLWLMYNDCNSSFLEHNLKEIIEFYTQDS